MASPKKSTDVHFEKTSLSQPSQQIAQEIVRDIMTKRKKKVDPQESKDVEPSKELPKSSSTTSKKPKRQVNITESEMNRLKSRGYTILRQVSKGCSGYIFLATFSRPLKKDVVMACKIIDKNNVEPKFASKFLPRELDILTVLNNPYCVNVFAILEMNSKCFVFMRYAERGDLLTYLTTYGALEEPHARMWIRQLLLGLKYLHSVNIAHRDIKCENILITENLNMKIGDFGFARYWKDEKGHDVLSETFCGSLSYAAPEILSGRKYSMKKCDIWSLGVVLFIMFNLAKPFTKNKAPALLQQQLSRAYKHNPRVERTINTFANDMLYSMLEPDFLLRPSADALLNCLWMKEDPDGYQKR
ncbi:testis-specific serine/threonine-protein kinase 3-like isoform X2 [Rhodnius prolixus]|uniref:testis-specific serine/threonine-protein kinase 3-like isoform X2 n=1 Tax=Rhodnius prolixus TaxID=13249 RepID=UPI003D18BE69